MNHVLKSFTELKKQSSNEIGDRLSTELADYGIGVSSDIGMILGVSGGAVSRWRLNANGINYTLAQKVGFLLGLTPDDLSNTGKFKKPAKSLHAFDVDDFAREILDMAPQIRVKEFMVDAVVRAKAHIGANAPKQPEHIPVATPKKSSDFLETVRGILETAEMFRMANRIEWVVKSDGSLGAKRTVVEEF